MRLRARGTLYSLKTILAAEIEVAAECIQPLRTVNESETHTFFLLFLLHGVRLRLCQLSTNGL